jgi:hypothetical protein
VTCAGGAEWRVSMQPSNTLWELDNPSSNQLENISPLSTSLSSMVKPLCFGFDILQRGTSEWQFENRHRVTAQYYVIIRAVSNQSNGERLRYLVLLLYPPQYLHSFLRGCRSSLCTVPASECYASAYMVKTQKLPSATYDRRPSSRYRGPGVAQLFVQVADRV